MGSMTSSEARAALPELLKRVSAGEEITITRYGTALAVVVRPDVLRARRAATTLSQAAGIHELLDTARTAPLPEARGLSQECAEELIHHIRTGREAR